MTYLIAAAGTGGHVYPGLAVGQALVDRGVQMSDVLYVGGSRMESKVYPGEGFPFLEVEIRGLKRSMSLSNLALPAVVSRARDRIVEAISTRSIRVILGMGGYVTIPAALAARRTSTTLMIAEQNSHAGLANRLAARWASRQFGSFPDTRGMDADWVGNPVRRAFWDFDRPSLAEAGRERYGLREGVPTLGVLGGSLGALAINDAVSRMLASWSGPRVQVVHLTGDVHLEALGSLSASADVTWIRRGFEDSIEHFYAVSDLVLARAGGGVAELAATATPAMLVPGEFGSAGHQTANALQFEKAGMALVVRQSDLSTLADHVERVLFDHRLLGRMAAAAAAFSRPRAAHHIALEMMSSVA